MNKILLVAASVGVLLGTADLAQARSGTPAQRRDCHDDAFRFCRNVIPDVPRVTYCMQRNVYHLSPACRRHFR